jgi:hypothetical protein
MEMGCLFFEAIWVEKTTKQKAEWPGREFQCDLTQGEVWGESLNCIIFLYVF